MRVGGVRLRFLAERRAAEALAGLVLEAADLAAARAALAAHGPIADGDGVRLDPARCHGVPLAVRRGA